MAARSTTTLAAAAGALLAFGGAGSVLAQVDPQGLHALEAARLEADALRREQAAAIARVQAAQDRAATAQTLRGLQARSASPDAAYRPDPVRPLPERGDPSAGLSLRLDQLDRLTDERLARSNEVLRGVKPASER